MNHETHTLAQYTMKHRSKVKKNNTQGRHGKNKARRIVGNRILIRQRQMESSEQQPYGINQHNTPHINRTASTTYHPTLAKFLYN
jgi:hypothetical protein